MIVVTYRACRRCGREISAAGELLECAGGCPPRRARGDRSKIASEARSASEGSSPLILQCDARSAAAERRRRMPP